jgi:hypothetical protein
MEKTLLEKIGQEIFKLKNQELKDIFENEIDKNIDKFIEQRKKYYTKKNNRETYYFSKKEI